MGCVINTVDGSMTVLSNQDVFDYIRKKCGDEVANFIECVAQDVEENTVYEQMKFNSDFAAIESENDGMYAAINNMRELLADMKSYIASGRINKVKLLQMIDNGFEELEI